ncbi:MAG: hypothetical protein U0491_02980 [Candidatus Saccharimonadales bacterium]
MVKAKSLLSRTSAIVTVATLAAASVLPVVLSSNAYALIQSRSITLSTPQASATNVTYAVRFQASAAMTIKGIIVDFCEESPIIGNGTCTKPGSGSTAFTVGTPTVNNYQNMSGWSATSGNSGRTLALTKAGGESLTTSGTPTYGFDITTVTNPDLGNHTYYARILLYANDTGANSPGAAGSGGYLDTGTPTVGTYLDAGGIALSTTNDLTVTAKVQERLTFCLYTSATCSTSGTEKDTTGANRTSNITLGDTNGVLDTAGPYVDKSAKFDISTNAISGAMVVLKGDTLKSGSFNVAAIGATSASSAAGTEQFGLCLYEPSANGLDITTGTVGNSTYNDSNCSTTSQTAGTGSFGGAGSAKFGFNTTNTLAASGDTIAKKPAGTTSTAQLAFIGNVAATTEAGIYTTTLQFIATGTY